MPKERLNSISLHQEMQRSYLEYAMSVIVGRALPDARDGLKPVQRRILYAMHELGLTPDRPFKKCARVVGDVLGKYHPHGDQAVYEALVRLVQDFTCKHPILDGHGNFGSIDDDPPAAMRYTETRLAEISNETILKEIDQETVDFSANFDGSQQEPTVLPAQVPFLILNGCTGIAVGMATSIPPHNLNEVINGLIELIKNPELNEQKLMKYIPAPDFPTGGEILLTSGIKETYLKGKGSIPMRGIAHIEDVYPGKGKHKRTGIVITELPYQVSKSGWIEKLAEQVNDGKILGIADIRDESDRSGMRILIEIRRDSDPNKVLNDLYRKTSLQSNFGATMLALVNGQPIQLSLKKLLVNFLEFRENTIIKRTKYSLNKINERLEIIEALIKALKNLKLVIELIEGAEDANSAKQKLKESLSLTNRQADGVLAMPLRRLTSLEKKSLRLELDDLKISKNKLENILEHREKLLNIMIDELKTIKSNFGKKRKTKLIKGGDALIAEKNALVRPNKELQRKQALENLPKNGLLVVEITNQMKILNNKMIKKLNINENLPLSKELVPAKLIMDISKKPKILAITSNGKVGVVQWEFSGQNPGNIEKFLPSGLEAKKIIDLIQLTDNKDYSLGLLTSDGRFKRLPIEEILDISNRSSTILKLKEHVFLQAALLCKKDTHLLVITNIGRILRLSINEEEFPLMGKLAQGPIIMNLFPNEFIINALSVLPDSKKSIVLITEKGSLIKRSIESIGLCNRGDLGIIGITLKDKSSSFDRVLNTIEDNNTSIILSSLNRIGQLSQDIIKDLTHNKVNKDILKMDSNERLNKVITVKSNIDL
tara:strand:+ start:167 stop:2650 length:2484 start_codon:yes stop_codon:yes gene_type:complete